MKSNKFKILLRGIVAGICNSIGGWLYLRARVDLHSIVVASFLFTTGSIFIAHYFFYLYTGQIGFIIERDGNKLLNKIFELLVGLVGNILGCMLMGFLIRVSTYDTNLELFAELENIVNLKTGYKWYQALILSFLCGMLIHIGVDGFRRIDNPLGRYLVLFLCIGGFTLAGFEHSVANMFFYFANNSYNASAFLSIFICVIGNSLGGIALSSIRLLVSNNQKSENL